MSGDRGDGYNPTEADRQRLEETAAAFERAWDEAGRSPLIDDFLPADNEPRRAALLPRLCKIDLQRRRRAGEPTRVEEYLERFPELTADAATVVDLILTEVDARASGLPDGSDRDGFLTRTLDECRNRFPHLATLLDSKWQTPPPTPPAGAAGPAAGAGAPVAVPSLPPGYTYVGDLGRGGMADVYLVRQVSFGRPVALKMLLSKYLSRWDLVERFGVEAHAVAGLHHSNIVQVYECGVHNGRPFFSQEYCPGGDLARKLGGLPAGPRDAAHWLKALAEGMQFAHEKGVIHRDVKPVNVLLGADGRPKMSDFGLAKMATGAPPASVGRPDPPGDNLIPSSDLTVPGGRIGTPSYMSPEQAAAADDVGHRADVYGLGAALYEMLTGRPPFTGDTNEEIYEQVKNDTPMSPRRLGPAIPRDLESICLKCLEKAPDKRYATAAALAEDLGRFLEGRPTVARPPWPPRRAWMWACRNKAGAVALSLVFLLLTGWANRESLLRRAAQKESNRAVKAENAAEQETDRAVKAENAALDLAHLERVRAARTAAGRGQWDEAETHYAEAVADDRDDRLALEVERLRGWWTYERRPQLGPELERLAGRDDLGPLRAVVLLNRGDYAMSDPDRQKEAHDWVAEALRTPEALSAADRAYAHGLLAATAAEAVARFEEAVKEDPFHYRANAALLTEFLMAGRFEEARRKADFMRQMYGPDDPLPAFTDAWVHLLEGRRKAALAEIERLRPRLGTRRTDDLLAFFNLMGDTLESADQINEGGPGAFLAVAAFPFKLKAFEYRRQVLEPIGFGVPTVARLLDTLSDLMTAYRDLLFGDEQAAVRRLARTAEADPDMFVLYTYAFARMVACFRRLGRGDRAGALRDAEEIADLYYRAAEAPSLLHSGPFRDDSRWFGVIMDGAILAERRNDRSAAAAGACAVLGAPPTPASGLAVGALLSAGVPAPDRARKERLFAGVVRLAEDGRAHPEERERCLPAAVGVLDPELGLLLLDGWLTDQPGNRTALRLRATTEMRGRDFGAALGDAERVLHDSPADAEMIKVRDAALAGLRTLLGNHPLAAPPPARVGRGRARSGAADLP